ncbi:hypothetical protein V2J09_023340 [Rumex salicifolius]
MKSSNCYGIVLFPLPFHGHMTPMLHLANALHSKGFSITIIHTKFGAPNVESYPRFAFRSIDDGIRESRCSDENIMGLFDILVQKCKKLFEDCLSEVLNESDASCPIACLISDPMWLFPGEVVGRFNLKNLALRTGSFTASVVYNSVEILIQNGYYSAQEVTPNKPITEFPPLKVKDLPVLYGDTKQNYLSFFSDYAAAIRTSSGFICNSFDELEPAALSMIRQDIPIPNFPVGPIHKHSTTTATKKKDHVSISWLNKQPARSVIYVSYGSTASVSEADFLEIALGLAQSQQQFLWAVRPGLIRNSKWIDPLPDGFMETVSGRGCIVEWAPQREVLAHPAIGGFLSHCGWNSVLESVAEGVPLICLPCFADQMMNARCVSDLWRVGIRLESGPRKEEIAAAIRRLMVEEEGQEIKDRMTCLKEKADVAIQGGTSCQAMEKLVAYILSFASSKQCQCQCQCQ